jgi:dipeptide/tripeptide permease
MPEILRAVEILAGLFYLVYGIDGFLKKLPMPEPSLKAKEFLIAIENTRFILPIVKLIEILVGLCFIFNFKAAIAWCLLSPLVYNILGYHFMLNKKEKIFPFFIMGLHLLLFYRYYPQLLQFLNF